jgi:hypothetical protein
MTKLSLLSAALAISGFAALPALAQGTPPVSAGATVETQSGNTGVSINADANDKAAAGKADPSKPQNQLAQHPDSKPQSDPAATSDTK